MLAYGEYGFFLHLNNDNHQQFIGSDNFINNITIMSSKLYSNMTLISNTKLRI